MHGGCDGLDFFSVTPWEFLKNFGTEITRKN